MSVVTSAELNLGRGKRKTTSLLERRCVRLTLSPQTSSKDRIAFSTTGHYDDCTEIYDIHKYVLSHLESKVASTPAIEQDIDKLRKKLHSQRLHMVDIKNVRREIESLEKKRAALLRNNELVQYQQRIKPVLDQWTALKEKDGPYFKFGEEQQFRPDKLELVRSFIKIASDYAPLNLTLKTNDLAGLCPYCRKPFEDEEDKIVCFECGIYQDPLTYDAEFGDIPKISSASNNNYMNRETFEKALTCFQGKQLVNFPDDLRKAFDEYCRFQKKDITTLCYESTRPIFKAIGYSAYFDDINLFLFMHPQIRRPLPDLSKWESAILEGYEKFSQKYAEVKGDDRDSALNAWYLLYILCNRYNAPCNKCDLKMPDTRSIHIANDRMARRVFQALGWKFEDTI